MGIVNNFRMELFSADFSKCLENIKYQHIIEWIELLESIRRMD
jgi:hypothetical protein